MSEEIQEGLENESIVDGGEALASTDAEGLESPADGEQGTPEPVEAGEATPFKFGELEVQVEVPDDLRSVLSEKELDADAIVKELYTSDDFSLTRETKEKLDAAFGKFFVDQYLASLRTTNEATINKFKSDKEAAMAATAEAEKWGVETVGGNWEVFEEKALLVMSDAQVEQFNEAMQSGNKFVQEYALKAVLDLVGKEAAPEIELSGEAPIDESGAINQRTYFDLLAQARIDNQNNPAGYQAAMRKLDARRRAGIARGI